MKGERIGVDASTMEANAALRNIVPEGHGRGLPGDWRAWPRRAASRHPRPRTWRAWTASARARSSRTRTGSRRATAEAKIAKMKDGTTHLAYKPEHAVDLDTGAVVACRATPGRRGRHDDAGEDAGGGQGESRGGGRGTVRRPGRMCDRQGLSLTVGLKGARLTAPGRRGSPSPSRKVSRAGTATGRPAGQSPTTGPGCYRAWPRKPSSCAPRSSSAPLRTTSIARMRRTWLRGRENVHKRYLLHVAGHNLSL